MNFFDEVCKKERHREALHEFNFFYNIVDIYHELMCSLDAAVCIPLTSIFSLHALDDRETSLLESKCESLLNDILPLIEPHGQTVEDLSIHAAVSAANLSCNFKFRTALSKEANIKKILAGLTLGLSILNSSTSPSTNAQLAPSLLLIEGCMSVCMNVSLLPEGRSVLVSAGAVNIISVPIFINNALIRDFTGDTIKIKALGVTARLCQVIKVPEIFLKNGIMEALIGLLTGTVLSGNNYFQIYASEALAVCSKSFSGTCALLLGNSSLMKYFSSYIKREVQEENILGNILLCIGIIVYV
jgi:hypothetical protein